MVVHGSIDGEPETLVVQLAQEVRNEVLALVVRNSKNGKWKEVSKDLSEKVMSEFSSSEFSIGEISDVVKKIYKGLTDSSVDTMAEWAEAYGMTKCVPDSIMTDEKSIHLSGNQKNALQYFADRQDFIEDCIKHCAERATGGKMVFGISFFDLIMRKPSSITYIVYNLFDSVKDKRNPNVLYAVINECREETEKYKQCMNEFVSSGKVVKVKKFTADKALGILDDCSASVRQFFVTAFDNGTLDLDELTEESFRMLVDLRSKISSVTSEFFLKKLGCKGRLSDVAFELKDIGIIGVNDQSLALFDDSLMNFVLEGDSRIAKSDEDVNALKQNLSDIDALLDTLIPIGGKISE
jgi:hypothetical protein